MKQTDPLTSLKGIGEKTASCFSKLGIRTVGDLLRFYPRDYDKMEDISPIRELPNGCRSVIRVTISSGMTEKRVRSLSILNCYADDTSGRILLTFFNMPFLKKTLKRGTVCILRGKVSYRGTTPVMEQPVILTATEYEHARTVLMPVYPLTFGLKQKMVRKAVDQALIGLAQNQELEYLPEAVKKEYHLEDEQNALRQIHFPTKEEDLYAGHGRLVFDEFYLFLSQIARLKKDEEKIPNQFPMLECADTERILQSLPYELTQDQEKVWRDLKEDLSGPYAMNRLIQGDVGSGKTILAILALTEAAANGYQGALMAPTEVLALQHFEQIRELSRKLSLRLAPVLLTGSLSAKDKKTVYDLIRTGKVNCIIGTHALFQEKVEFQKLSLVITDEQHRFGVHQREDLIQKGTMPHVLVMSATPIPRTLALILYGDMHISTITHLPAQRKPIKNAVIPASDRPKAYRFMEKQLNEGRQIFIICPMIEASENGDEEVKGKEQENVTDYAKKIKELFPRNTVGILHGRMKPADKNTVMYAFSRGEIQILVSTTVVEVGVNVPNASVMMIENAEHFGLAQLHQLRGRVGRGEYQSYCIFVNSSDTEKSKERLQVLASSNDGFYIAEKDLKLRGPGDLFGIRQSGDLNFKLADIYQDAEYLQMAKEAVERYPIDIQLSTGYHFTNL